MASLRDIRGSITSVKATKQIMATMKMIASARIKKAQSTIMSARPFADKMREMIDDLQEEFFHSQNEKTPQISELYNAERSKDALGLILITGDKGLCGAFNVNTIRTVLAWLKEHRHRKIYAFVVGRKGRDFIKRIKDIHIEIMDETIGIFPKASYVNAEIVGAKVLDAFIQKNIGEVTMIYSKFESLLSQKPVTRKLLPLKYEAKVSSDENSEEKTKQKSEFIFEPGKEEFLQALLPRYVKGQIYRAILESQAAELAARMNAMESANKNAQELIEYLTLKLNRTRQEQITKELSEIVAGSEALNK
jgi:F-type H+-transporting ATPase subunit gamma